MSLLYTYLQLMPSNRIKIILPSLKTECNILILFSLFLQTKTKMGEVMREAAFSLAEAKFAAGDFR